jgi:hypothetical protein
MIVTDYFFSDEGLKFLEYNSSIRRENNTEKSNNRILKNLTKRIEQKQNRSNNGMNRRTENETE